MNQWMKTMATRALAAVATTVLVTSLAAGGAMAQSNAATSGMLLEPSQLTESVRADLLSQIDASRTTNAQAFESVSMLMSQAEELNRKHRARAFPFSRSFRALKADGVLPLIEVVAFSGRSRGSLDDAGWDALRAGALQALGESRDLRARPVIEAVLRGNETSYQVVRAAAAAIGEYGDDAAVATLIEMSQVSGAKQNAILDGMGHCRRAAIAGHLSGVLAARPQGIEGMRLMESLRDSANSWAWDTPAVQSHGDEELATRQTATQALLSAYVDYDGQLRTTALKAILVVDHPDTATYIEQAKAAVAADADKVKALEYLTQRFANNPLHRLQRR